MRRTIILLASLSIMLLGIWGSAVIYLDEDRLKSIVTSHLSQQMDRKIEIRGSLSVRFFPGLRVHAEDIVISGPEGFESPHLLEAEQLAMSIRLLPLIRGNFSPGDVNLIGATVNLATNREGKSSVDGLRPSSTDSAERSDRLLSTRELRLEDVRVVIADERTDRMDSLMIDFIELERFAFDEPLEFQFRGNLGDPQLFTGLDLEGLLVVPSTAERPVRLANMRMGGRLTEGGYPLEVRGHLSMLPKSPFHLELQDGRLDVAGLSFDFELGYDESTDSVLKLAARGDQFHWPFPGAVNTVGEHPVMTYLRVLDTDLVLAANHARIHGFLLEDFALQVSSRNETLYVETFQGLASGAIVTASGYKDLRDSSTQGVFELEVAIDQASSLLASMGVPPVISGSGLAELSVRRSPLTIGNGTLAVGHFELWDGRWQDRSEAAGTLDFDRLAGSFRWMPEAIDVSDLSVRVGESEKLGWLSMSLSDHAIAGQVTRFPGSEEMTLSGHLDRPVWVEYENGVQLDEDSLDNDTGGEPSSDQEVN